jgi:hypothetical protein
MTKKNIYVTAGIVGLAIGGIVGRFVYLNNVEVYEAQKNINPQSIDEVTNGHPELLDYYDEPSNQDSLQQEDLKFENR